MAFLLFFKFKSDTPAPVSVYRLSNTEFQQLLYHKYLQEKEQLFQKTILAGSCFFSFQ